MRHTLSLFLFFICTAAIAENLYSMADLELLAEKKAYKEYFKHTFDIKPSSRTEYWEKLLVSTTDQFISEQISSGLFTRKNFLTIENIFKWPWLHDNLQVKNLRDKFGINYFKRCFGFENKTQCKSELDVFIKSSPIGPLTSYNVGIIVQENIPSIKSSELWPYFKLVTQSTLGSKYCSQKPLNKILLEKLAMNLTSPDKFLTLSKDCWESYVPFLEKSLIGEYQYLKDISFKILKKYKKLSNESRESYYLSYILNEPKVGPRLNISWNLLETYGTNYKKRESIISKLKSNSTLNNKTLFNLTLRKKAIIKLLSKNFPEYINLHTRNCLDKYVDVNNAQDKVGMHNCEEYLDFASKNNYISKLSFERFKKLKR